MKRVKLKEEEVSLREAIFAECGGMPMDIPKKITALIRAVRADEREKCVKVAYEEALRHHSGNAKWDMNVGENIAAAIRGRK